VGRDGTARSYTLGNAANEYATVDPDGSGGSPAAPVGYDAAGNLSVDEAGREYEYDEYNRLTGVIASDGTTVLAEYAYDALGRRIRSSILVTAGSPPVVTRYYHDGSRMIEERDGSDARRRYHVNGGQYIDEHVETFKDDAGRAGEATYYLSNLDYSVAGTGNADGTVIERLDYTSGGDFVEGEPPGPCVRGDVSGDGRIDGRDAQTFINVLLGLDTNAVHICAADIDVSGGVNLADAPLFVECLLAGGCPAEVECTRADVNDDGHVDGRDAQTFINVLLGLDTNAVHTCAADINDSGTVNLTDVPLFVQCLLAGGCGGGQPLCRRGDVNNDGLVTIADVGPFVSVLLAGTGTAQQVCAADLGGPAYTIPGTPDGLIDGNDIQAFLDCLLGGQCPPAPPGVAGILLDGDIGSVDPPVGDVGWMGDLAWMGERKVVPLTPWVADDAALQPRSGRALPAPGTFAMHGCPIDVLLDGLVLQYNRARYYDVKNGRWLQRDPSGYVDGGNLYEAFRTNPLRWQDPQGAQASGEALPHFGPTELVFEQDQLQIAMDRETGRVVGVALRTVFSLPWAWAKQAYYAFKCDLTGEMPSLQQMPLAAPVIQGLQGARLVANEALSEGYSPADAYAIGFIDGLGNFVPFQNSILNLAEGKDRYGNVIDPAEQVGGLLGEGVLVYVGGKAVGGLGGEVAAASEVRCVLAARPVVKTLARGTPAGGQLLFDFMQPESAVGAAEFGTLRGTVGFLRSQGLSVGLRREMIEAGFQGAISEAKTPWTYIRFQHLFPETAQAGKGFAGRLGNVPTRVATIMESQTLERSGLFPRFEFPTSGGHFIDLVGVDVMGNPIPPATQFVKWHRLWSEEIPKGFLITRETGLPVRFVVTGP
jgi:RHS repeat-associated protein